MCYYLDDEDHKQDADVDEVWAPTPTGAIFKALRNFDDNVDRYVAIEARILEAE